MTFFIGGYAPELRTARLDPSDGSMEILGSVPTPENASFLRYVPELSALYATVEAGSEGGDSGSIAAYRVHAGGKLTPMGTASSCGPGPCHLAVHPRHRLLTAANYVGGSVCAIQLESDGALGRPGACIRHTGRGVNPGRQEKAHAHATTFSPDGRSVFVCDLGIDKIMRYEVDALLAGAGSGAGAGAGAAAGGDGGADGGEIPGSVAATVRPGSGPRHMEFSADGKHAYLLTELENTVVVYALDEAGGGLEAVQEISALPDDFVGESTAAEVQLHPNGSFLYASNRGHDSVAVFGRDEVSGRLEAAGHFSSGGRGPRHFQVDPSGRWCLVANQFSDTVLSFRVDPASGEATATGRSVRSTAPSCVEVLCE